MQRTTAVEKWSYCDITLTTGAVAEKGHIAAIEKASGEVVVATTDTTLRAIGYFDENLTGDGVKTVRIKLFREVVLHEFRNDGVSPVAANDVGNDCYLAGSDLVSMDGTGRSVAGLVWKVKSTGVLVEMAR